MTKQEIEYNNLYGNIPNSDTGRLDYLLSVFKSTNNLKGKILSSINKIKNIKWNEVSYTIYLIPKATPRPRSTSNGMFYVKGAADNKKIFKKFFKDNDFMIYTPCKFYCTSYLPIPNSMNNLEKILAELGYIRPISKPDFDNLAKTYSDMIQGSLLYDDQLIIEGYSYKYYSVKPRIEIKIEYMEEYDSQFNLNKSKRMHS